MPGFHVKCTFERDVRPGDKSRRPILFWPSDGGDDQSLTATACGNVIMAPGLNSSSASFCFLDFDLGNYREKLATAAAFVDATDSRYGFSSKDLKLLGGSEVSRIKDLISTDHEWSAKAACMGVEIRPPVAGNRIVIRLYWDVAPMACENFATLCANGSLLPGSTKKKAKPAPIGESGKPLTYRKSIVHRVVPKFIIQGGDVSGGLSGG